MGALSACVRGVWCRRRGSLFWDMRDSDGLSTERVKPLSSVLDAIPIAPQDRANRRRQSKLYSLFSGPLRQRPQYSIHPARLLGVRAVALTLLTQRTGTTAPIGAAYR